MGATLVICPQLFTHSRGSRKPSHLCQPRTSEEGATRSKHLLQTRGGKILHSELRTRVGFMDNLFRAGSQPRAFMRRKFTV